VEQQHELEETLMKILTLNLRHNADRWLERLPLVVDVLKAHQPDIIGFQEVWMASQQAHTILQHLPDGSAYSIYTTPKQNIHGHEGIALASRYPVLSHETFDLPGGERVAQRIIVEVNHRKVCVANTHLHHRPQDESVRLPQMQALLQWLNEIDLPLILTGDMNAVPATSTIAAAKEALQSAYEALHGSEPEHTFPTALVAAKYPAGGVTIDYIFFTPKTLKVQSAAVVADNVHPDDAQLCPSDHYGLLAQFQLTD
jgi:endonuclease/exonuclease/phosphatase family metal-dependent hydrolase